MSIVTQRNVLRNVLTVLLLTALSASAVAGPLDLFKTKAEADPNKEYVLTEAEGPYLIYVVRFFGQPDSRQKANALILEIRKTLHLNAFLYEKKIEHDINQDFKNVQRPGSPMKFKYLKEEPVHDFAVLIGNFPSTEDKRFKSALDEIKKFRPTSIPVRNNNPPFTNCFALTNPILPPENQRGIVDKFIESINIKRPYTLLRNPKPYTVQIATFTGRVAMQHEIDKLLKETNTPPKAGKMTDLEKGEQAAVLLCKHLRERGIEAYEFHDRYASIVTVGSFDYYGRRMPDGTVAVDPQVLQVIQTYQGKVTGGVAGQPVTHKPVIIGGFECDMLPKVIEVPRCRRGVN